MKHKRLTLTKGFRVLFRNRRAQAAEMVIAAGAAEGGPGNRHRDADQWLYVIDGTGIAFVKGKRISLGAGSLLLIPAWRTARDKEYRTAAAQDAQLLCAAGVSAERRRIAPRKTVASRGRTLK
jgi:gentisate 1,2-dioxygenase